MKTGWADWWIDSTCVRLEKYRRLMGFRDNGWKSATFHGLAFIFAPNGRWLALRAGLASIKESALTSDGSTPNVAVNLATAYHEAGHAVVALALGRNVQRVSILPNQLRLGKCELKKGRAKSAHDPVEVEILILLGGVAAEACYTGEYAWAGAQQDIRAVRAMTSQRASGEKQVARLERRLLDKVEHLLAEPAIWRATEWIAAELLRCTTISGRAARHLFDQAAAQME